MKLVKDVYNFGIGADIEEVSRFRKLNKIISKNFLDKTFTKKEVKYCFSKTDFAPSLAARFAAKEAIIKALTQAGILTKLKFIHNSIEIKNDPSNVPRVKLKGKNFNKAKIFLTISHTKKHAIAVAVIFS